MLERLPLGLRASMVLNRTAVRRRRLEMAFRRKGERDEEHQTNSRSFFLLVLMLTGVHVLHLGK